MLLRQQLTEVRLLIAKVSFTALSDRYFQRVGGVASRAADLDDVVAGSWQRARPVHALLRVLQSTLAARTVNVEDRVVLYGSDVNEQSLSRTSVQDVAVTVSAHDRILDDFCCAPALKAYAARAVTGCKSFDGCDEQQHCCEEHA